MLEEENLFIYDPTNQDNVNGYVSTVQIVASDVVALFPSMRAEEIARICSKMVLQSELEF